MRKMQKPPVGKTREKKQEPLAEGLQIVPTDSAGRRLWKKMNDEQIVEFAKKLMEEKGLTKRKELQKADQGLYFVLRIRGLLGEVGFDDKLRSWKDMSNTEVVEFAQKFMEENGITWRSELKKADCGLYGVLKRRGLLGEVGFEEKKRKERIWTKMDEEEIVEVARRSVKEREITERDELKKTDSGLYEVLRKRGLLDKVGLEERKRAWNKMSDEEVVEFAQKFMEKKKITGRIGLQKADSGLYEVLRKRGLLDRVFAHIERQRDDNARDAVINALTEFAKSENPEVEIA